jgi:hypothetical protein
MASALAHVKKLGLLNAGAPGWLSTNLAYEVIMGSVAYGVSNDLSDMDVYGWTIPSKDLVFPHTTGAIDGFGRQKQRFDVYQQHHIKDTSTGRVYDFSIYNIVRYFHLCMENNPNMIDSLFVPQRCILHMTPVAQMVRERRKEFLHKGCYHKLKGYAFAQLSKMDVKKQDVPEVHEVWGFEEARGIPRTMTLTEAREELQLRAHNPQYRSRTVLHGLNNLELDQYVNLYTRMMNKNKRLDGIKRFGFDVKFAYHVIRLASECEQILIDGDLDLEEQGRREHMKAVRRGDLSQDDIRAWFTEKEKSLGALYEKSTLRNEPDEAKIKQLLVDCLEQHYGRLSQAELVVPDRSTDVLREIAGLVDRWRNQQGG